jgi:hypothetical protein
VSREGEQAQAPQDEVHYDHAANDGASTDALSNASGDDFLNGQATRTVVVNRPEPGQTVVIDTEPGTTYVLNFNPEAADVSANDGDLVMIFAEGPGGQPTRLVFEELAAVAEGPEPVFLQIAGVTLDADGYRSRR